MIKGKSQVMMGHRVWAIVQLCLWLLLLFGCSAPEGVKPDHVGVVQPGDVADIRFLCRLQSGEVVAATDKAVGQETALPKSPVFLSRESDDPLSLTAGAPLPEPPEGKERSFEEEIINRIAGALVGIKEGESRLVSLTAEELPERSQDNYTLRVARIRERSKVMTMPIDAYRSRTGKTPEAGQSFVIDPAVPGRVETVTQEEVVIRFSAQPGEVVQTPFGPGVIRETDQNYEIVIGAHKGALVRIGHLVGRITDVDEQYIVADFRNPFGGETLLCDVTVGKIKHETTESTEKTSVQKDRKADQKG